MIAATHFDNLLVLLFFGVAIFFQLISAATSKKRKRPGETRPESTSPPQTSREIETEEEQSDEDSIRKFLEALGQPTTSKPPAPRPSYQKPIVVQKEQDTLRRRWIGTELPPLTTRPPDLPPEVSIQPIPKAARKTFKQKVAEPATFEVQQAPSPITEAEVKTALQSAAAQPTAKPLDVATLLRSTSGLRNAIILREIFGPPRSMQPLDLVGNG
jgi:hypothetical protein